MPNWNEVLKEITDTGKGKAKGKIDINFVRRKYLAKLSTKTGRNTIAYYSGWLDKPPQHLSLSVNDEDKIGFMTTIHKMDTSLGLDLILHTPGGDIAAAESIVDYLRQIFGTNVRAIIPQLAMSAGTMMACSCKCIIMGKQSNLGPIDPQLNGMPASGVIQEFDQALEEITKKPNALPLWQIIINKYHPTFIGSCKKAVKWSQNLVQEWIKTGMLIGDSDATLKAAAIAVELSDIDATLAHNRHIHLDALEKMGLIIEKLEDDNDFQDLVLSVHHSFMHTFSMSSALKIIENQNGIAFIKNAPLQK